MPKRTDSKPWERIEGESVKAYEAFTVYLNMGAERSLIAVARRLSKSKTLMARWSSTYGWVERVAAYDADVQRRVHAEAVKSSRKMNDRHISIALKMQKKALEALAKMRPEDLDAKNLVAFIREATKLERDNRAEIVHDTDPDKGQAAETSSLADVISEAWERRQRQNEADE